MAQKITGKIVDILDQKIFDGEVEFDNGKIISINPVNLSTDQPVNYILPGFMNSSYVISLLLISGGCVGVIMGTGAFETMPPGVDGS